MLLVDFKSIKKVSSKNLCREKSGSKMFAMDIPNTSLKGERAFHWITIFLPPLKLYLWL